MSKHLCSGHTQGRSQNPDFGGGAVGWVDNKREKLKILGLLNCSFWHYVNDQSKAFLKYGLFLPRTPPPPQINVLSRFERFKNLRRLANNQLSIMRARIRKLTAVLNIFQGFVGVHKTYPLSYLGSQKLF